MPLKTLVSALVAPAINHDTYTQGMVQAWSSIESAISVLVVRFTAWFSALSGGRITNDPLINTLMVGLGLWLAAGWAAWWVRKHNLAILGLLPAAILLSSLSYYNNLKSISFLALLGGIIVLLEGMSGFGVVFQRWQKNRLDQADDVQPEIVMSIIGMAALLMMAGWILTSIPVEKITDDIQKYFEARAKGNSFQTISQDSVPAAPLVLLIKFPSIVYFKIDGYPKLSNQIVMYVSVEGYQPKTEIAGNNSQNEVFSQPYYWRTLTYSEYGLNGWSNSTSGTNDYNPGYTLPGVPSESPSANYQLVRQHVTYADKKGGPVVAAGQMISLDQSYNVYWRGPEDLIAAQTEAFAYIATSRLPLVTANQLRQAGSNYPASLEKYLQLPDELPARVRNLVLDLTTTQPTPYDQVMALQTYLRSFPYTLDVPAPPYDRDIADYFLFDLKKGYCNYYATAMAAMARVVGIPSRLVTGFSSGQYDEKTGSFVVTGKNAHTWVEIYFPGIGWMEFEPTAALPPIERPDSIEAANAITPAAVVSVENGSNVTPTTPINKPLSGVTVLVFATMTIVLLFFLFFLAERLILLLYPSGRAVTKLYRRVYRLGSSWFAGNNRAYTPYEFATELSARLTEHYQKEHMPPIVTTTRAELAWLTDLYNRTLYSSCSPTRLEHHRAVQTWFRLRRHLSWLRFEKTFTFLKKSARLSGRIPRANKSHRKI
jgi:transglutaminase-like putative cysteine protease